MPIDIPVNQRDSMTQEEWALHHRALAARLRRLQSYVNGHGIPPAHWTDFGAADAYSRWQLRQIADVAHGGSVTLIDFNADLLRGYPKESLICDLMALPADFETEFGFSSHVLEHVTDLGAVLGEIRRVTRRGFWAVVPLQGDVEAANYTSHVRHSPDPEVWMMDFRNAGWNPVHHSIEEYFNGLKELDCWMVPR